MAKQKKKNIKKNVDPPPERRSYKEKSGKCIQPFYFA